MPTLRNHSNMPIVYFDGQCNFCYGLIQMLKRLGLEQKVHLLPFQLVSSQAQDELIFINESGLFKADKAVLQLLHTMGGIFRLTGRVLSILPSALLQKTYYVIAQNRYHIFGNHSCSIN